MPQENHFDVIIIGTGAGGGTLAYHLAPSGKRILLLERGGYLPQGKGQLGLSAPSFSNRNTGPRKPGTTRTEIRSTQAFSITSAGIRRFTARRCCGFAREDFGEVRHYGGISPAWPLNYEDFEPYYTKAEHLYHVHGEHGIDPTEGPASAPYRYPPVSHEPRIQELYDDLQRRAIIHSLCRSVSCSMKKTARPCTRALACGVRHSTDFHAWSTAKQMRRSFAWTRLSQHPNVQLLTGAYVKRLETDAVRSRGNEGPGRARRAIGGIFSGHRGRLLRSDQLRSSSAALCQRQAPEWAREQFGCGGAPLHAAQQLRLYGHFQDSPIRPCSRKPLA